ncbi:transmembrane protein 14C isoform X3 [Xiphophorus couchianus]|uniref:transmembrane protein 14C isoform X3 n=1 Tax=Xiphophorus couchianus TaxID=32473 RepID=UPI0010160F59|nr:uncharacterized protein LOC114136681 isoform X3 [Xiphophorus couchianus]
MHRRIKSITKNASVELIGSYRHIRDFCRGTPTFPIGHQTRFRAFLCATLICVRGRTSCRRWRQRTSKEQGIQHVCGLDRIRICHSSGIRRSRWLRESSYIRSSVRHHGEEILWVEEVHASWFDGRSKPADGGEA